MTKKQIEEIVYEMYPKLSDAGASDYLKKFRDRLRNIINKTLENTNSI